jgi:hypothetical protein
LVKKWLLKTGWNFEIYKISPSKIIVGQLMARCQTEPLLMASSMDLSLLF